MTTTSSSQPVALLVFDGQCGFCTRAVEAIARLEERDGGPALMVQVLPRKNGKPSCSGCGRPGTAYDRLEERHFEFVPVWGMRYAVEKGSRRARMSA